MALAGFVSRIPKTVDMRFRFAFLRDTRAAVLVATLMIAGVAAARAAMPQDGTPAPAVPTLQSVIGGNYEPFDLKTASTGKTVVLYFFPKAFTEG